MVSSQANNDGLMRNDVLLTGMSENDVRLQLAEQEAIHAAAGTFSLHSVSPSAFMSQLLELQDQQ